MKEEGVLDFKPRARGLVIGNIPWLARAADKARAVSEGRIGDYIYPCPADQAFLREVKISAEDFTALVMASADDEEVIKRMKAHLAKKGK
jgi:23S rRNA G2445 N2-methylase RlmL